MLGCFLLLLPRATSHQFRLLFSGNCWAVRLDEKNVSTLTLQTTHTHTRLHLFTLNTMPERLLAACYRRTDGRTVQRVTSIGGGVCLLLVPVAAVPHPHSKLIANMYHDAQHASAGKVQKQQKSLLRYFFQEKPEFYLRAWVLLLCAKRYISRKSKVHDPLKRQSLLHYT